jgi:hypothetical protein
MQPACPRASSRARAQLSRALRTASVITRVFSRSKAHWGICLDNPEDEDANGKPCLIVEDPADGGGGGGSSAGDGGGGGGGGAGGCGGPCGDGSGGGGGGGGGKPKNAPCPQGASITRWLPHALGGIIGGEIGGGLGKGAPGGTANGSLSGGFFLDNNGDVTMAAAATGGALTGGTSYVAAPAQTKTEPAVAGLYAGAGGGAFFTNAQSGNQLAGPFAQYNVNVGVEGAVSVSLAYDSASGIWVVSVTVRPGYGVSASKLTTTTATASTSGSCQ